MPDGNRNVVLAFAGLVILILGVATGWLLQPEEPSLTSNAGYQSVAPDYHPGGRDCEPARIKKLPSDRERAEKTISCQESAEQHRLAGNDLIQQRRAADAANAMTVLTYEQTGVAAWGLALGFITMGAAIAAAFYARSAAVHSDKSHKAFVNAERAILRVVSAREGSLTGSQQDQGAIAVTFKNIGRTSGRITAFGSKTQNSAPRWCDVPPDREVVVAGPALPDDRNVILKGQFWIEYSIIGGETGATNFGLTGRYHPPDGPFAGGWFFEVANTNGHPDDT